MTTANRTMLRALSLAGLLVAASWPAEAQIASGSYVGNGAAGRAITGVGFRPDIVIVKVDFDGGTDPNPPCSSLDDCSSAVIRTSTMAGANSKPVKGNQAYAANMITALNADGFSAGNDRKVNALNSCPASTTTPCTYYWVAIKANANIKVGSYTGNNGTQAITGLGFSPEWVTTIPTDTASPMMRFSVDANSYHWWSGGPLGPAIASLDASGFTVQNGCGGSCDQNANTVTYHYVAMNDTPGQIKVGLYAGNNATPRSITGAGFRPQYVMTRGLSPATFEQCERTSAMPALQSVTFRGALTSVANGNSGKRIRALEVDGFAIGGAGGAGDLVNATGSNYAYLAIATNGCCNLSDDGSRDGTVTVNAPNQFEMRFNAALGGGIDQLFDLAEDPAKAVDLAGGVNDLRTLHDFEIAPDSGGFAGVNHTTEDNTAGAKVDLLEATATRVRVRQEAFFQQDGGANILGGLKGIGDYSVYGSGRTAVRWTETDWNTAAFGLCQAPDRDDRALHGWRTAQQLHALLRGQRRVQQLGRRRSGGGLAPGRAQRHECQDGLPDHPVAGLGGGDHGRVPGRHRGGPGVLRPGLAEQPGAEAALLASETWNLLTYFKPTNLGVGASPLARPRRDLAAAPTTARRIRIGGERRRGTERTRTRRTATSSTSPRPPTRWT